MKLTFTHYRFWFCLCLLSLLWEPARAQTTTATLTGKLVSDKGEELIGVTVLALYGPTGTKRGTATDLDGRFAIPNLTPGGPYLVVVSYVGFRTQRINDVYLTLGNTSNLSVMMEPDADQLNALQTTAVVVGNAQAIKGGTGTNVSLKELQTLPTLARSLQDFTRLNPQSANNSFAGSSFRYNNVTLDGAINNDAIGFSPSLGGVGGTSGLPGGAARTNPIALDAIQEIQVQVAPYDVQLGNFTGASINAVTRSGTNEVQGSVYAYGRNQDVAGKDIEGNKLGTGYHDFQTGFRLGGPLRKDKLFFFVNAEVARNQAPVPYGVGQAGSPLTTALAAKLVTHLRDSYQYNPGETGAYNTLANSTKLFGRLDWNLSDKTSLTLRHNFVKALATNLDRSQTLFAFGSQDFNHHNLQNSTVLELKSNFSSTLSNSLVMGYTNIRDYRDPLDGASAFPQVQINNVGTSDANGFAGSNAVLLGSNREAAVFNLYQKTFEISDNFTVVKGRNTLTLGTHNELYFIDYGFINSFNGRLEYGSVADFLSDRPSRVRGSLPTPGRNSATGTYNAEYRNPAANFRLDLLSAYLQDEIAVGSRLKITPGIRLDYATLPDKPVLDPRLRTEPTVKTISAPTYSSTKLADFTNDILGTVQLSPRLGFSYDAKGDGSLVLRGGSGVFTGRMPLAWLGYAYYNNGVNFTNVDYINAIPAPTAANPNPTRQVIKLDQNAENIYNNLLAEARGKAEINLIDNNFRMPQVWRSSLALDFNKLPGGLRASLEGIYTKVLFDVKFQQINLVDSAIYFAAGPTQTPRYQGSDDKQRRNPRFSNVFLMSNTQEGYRYQLTGSLAKDFGKVLAVSAAYTYGQSKDISNGIRNSFQSNWELNPAQSPNSPGLAYSNFDLRHRVLATLNYRQPLGERLVGYLTGVFTFQSGTPFTYVYNNNFFGNGQQAVQLAYVPASASDIVLVDAALLSTGTLKLAPASVAADLDQFLANDDYLSTRRGQYTERNGAHTPWNNQVDLRLMLEARLGSVTPDPAGVMPHGHTIQISFDIINVGNLLNDAWGRRYYTPDTFNSTAGFGLRQVGYANASGILSTSAVGFDRPAFTYSKLAGTAYSIDPFASRWQGQLGLRYSF